MVRSVRPLRLMGLMIGRLGFLGVLSIGLLAGCGGGGSPGKSVGPRGNGVISVTLDADSTAGIEGRSYAVGVYRNDGTEVDKKAVDLSSGTRQIDFSGLPDGTLRLHVGVSATPGGPETGAVDTMFQGGGAASPILVRKGGNVSRLVVASPNTSVSTNAVQPFYAAARTADGAYVPIATGGLGWTTDTPSIALVDSDGKVTGVDQGTATIRATLLATGVSGTTPVSVLSAGKTRGKWTIMVYMNAANDLYQFAPSNLNQMESIANNPDVRFVVQWKQVRGLGGKNLDPLFSGTRRYLAAYDGTSLSSSNNPIRSTLVEDLGADVDMGSPATLNAFVEWTKAKYPADHYALVLWSHGGGWYSSRTTTSSNKVPPRAIVYDEDKGTSLSLPDIRDALPANGLDILSYDACLMQSAESLLEFSDRTKYIVGSEDNVPGPGLPYHIVFKPFVSAPETAAAQLSAAMVRAYVDRYKNDSGVGFPVQMSALATAGAPNFQIALDNFGMALLNDPGAGSVMTSVRTAATRIEPDDGYFYYDVDQLASILGGRLTLNGTTRAAAAALRTAAGNAVVATANGDSGANLKGLSIDFTHSGEFTAVDPRTGASTQRGYSRLQLAHLTHWDDFLANSVANP